MGRMRRYDLNDELHMVTPVATMIRPPTIPVPSWFNPARVSPALRENRDSGKVKLREEKVCRMCQRSNEVCRLTRHHLIPQSAFSWGRFGFGGTAGWRLLRDADANIVPLCRQCHDLVESGVWSRRLLRRVLLQAEIAFVIQVRGKEWFEARYPSVLDVV